MTGSRIGAIPVVIALTAGIAACGSSTAAKSAGTTPPPPAAATSTSTTIVPRSGTITVTASDYAYAGVPELVASGATFTMHNVSRQHIHEMVAVKVPATEHRSLAELTKLSHGNLVAALGVRPTFVMLQPPGAAVIKGIGDGTVTEPGRYLLVCSVQLNVTVPQYFQALVAHPGEAPEIPGGGLPHYTQGMYAGFTVQ